MRKLTGRLVFPLTLVSYLLLGKWWYVDVTDGPDVVAHGFPVISNAPSLDSSMETTYFIPETIIDISAHFVFWLLVVFIVNRWIIKIRIPSLAAKIFAGAFIVWTIAFSYRAITFNDSFSWGNDVDVKVLDSGFEWGWQHSPVPDYNKYHPGTKKLVNQ